MSWSRMRDRLRNNRDNRLNDCVAARDHVWITQTTRLYHPGVGALTVSKTADEPVGGEGHDEHVKRRSI
jgi:hypothetical protein